MSEQNNQKKSLFNRLNPFSQKEESNDLTAFNLNEDKSMQASNEVIESIVHNSAENIDGVHGLRDGVLEKATSIFSRKSSGKGVTVTEKDGKLVTDIFLYADYGANIVKVSRDVQTAVKTELSAMTELPVGDINIHVLDVIPVKSKTKAIDADHLFDKKTKPKSKPKTDVKKVAEPKKAATKKTSAKKTTAVKKKNSTKND